MVQIKYYEFGIFVMVFGVYNKTLFGFMYIIGLLNVICILNLSYIEKKTDEFIIYSLVN